MAHPLELCPTGRDCVACPHLGAFWAPVRLWTGVLGVKGVLEASARSPRHKGEARSEQRDAFVMLCPGMAGTLPFLPQLRLLPLQRPLSLPSLVGAHAFSIAHPKLFI